MNITSLKTKLYTILILVISLNIVGQIEKKINIINSTFLGGEGRNYYGNTAPEKLNIKWKYHIGKGRTTISRKIGEREWTGAGWTGQPLLVKENDSLFIIQGCYDHHLKKINAESGKLVWQYKIDDVIKGTGTIWHYNGTTLYHMVPYELGRLKSVIKTKG